MDREQLLALIESAPEDVEFDQVMAVIDRSYDYAPTAFSVGSGPHRVESPAGSNEGSCKIFAFARLAALSPQQTLACFGHYYRDDVLGRPDGADHANIRAFMRFGPRSVVFDGEPLQDRGGAG